MKTQMLKKINMMKKEKKLKEFVILLFKKVWVKVEKVLEMMMRTSMMKISDLMNIFI